MGKTVCPDCGKKIPLNDEKCPNCGYAMRPDFKGLLKERKLNEEPRARLIETNKVKQQIDERIRQRKNREKNREEFMNKQYGGDVKKYMQNEMLEKQNKLSLVYQEQHPFENKDPSVPDLKGLDLLEHMKYPEAVKYYQLLVSKEAKNQRFWNNLGVAFMGLKNRKNALYCYDQSLNINQKYYIGWYNKGAVYYECKKFEKAIECFDKALELNPICGEAYIDRKIARENLGQIDLLSSDDFELMQKGMNPLRARSNLSSALVDLGNGKDAILGNAKIILKHQERLEDIFDAGYVYEQNGDINSALASYEEGLSLNPESAALWYEKGRILAQMKDVDKALTCLSNAIKYDPIISDPILVSLAYKIRSAMYWVKGQIEQSQADMSAVESINPFDEHIQKIRSRPS